MVGVPLVRKALCTQTCSPRYREVIVLLRDNQGTVLSKGEFKQMEEKSTKLKLEKHC